MDTSSPSTVHNERETLTEFSGCFPICSCCVLVLSVESNKVLARRTIFDIRPLDCLQNTGPMYLMIHAVY